MKIKIKILSILKLYEPKRAKEQNIKKYLHFLAVQTFHSEDTAPVQERTHLSGTKPGHNQTEQQGKHS